MRYVAVVPILLLGLLTCPCFGQDADPMLLHQEASIGLFEQGRQEILNFRLYEAERTFRRLSHQPDGRPAAYHHLATISFLKALVTDEPVYFDEFFERSDSLMAVLDEREDSKWRAYLYAETSLQRAVSSAKTERYVRAALAGRTAYRQFKDAAEKDSRFAEPYKGLGMFHVLIGSLPTSQRRLLSVLGYSGDLQRGLRELRRAADQSRYNREEAALYLALADVMLFDSTREGLEILEGLHARLPESPLFAYLYGYALLMNREAGTAETLLQSAVDAGRSADYFFIDYAEFYLAQALFRQNRFSEAEGYYRHYLDRHRGSALKSLAYLEFGLTLEMQDRRAEALAAYSRVTGDRIYDSDAYSYRLAQRYLSRPMTSVERQLLLGRNAFDAGRYALAASLLEDVMATAAEGTSAKGEAAYRLGRVYRAQGRVEEALSAHRYAIAHPGDDPHARWAPWSQYYIGELMTEHGDTLQATEAFEKALAYEQNFDYHQSLEQRAKAALGRLREETRPEGSYGPR